MLMMDSLYYSDDRFLLDLCEAQYADAVMDELSEFLFLNRSSYLFASGHEAMLYMTDDPRRSIICSDILDQDPELFEERREALHAMASAWMTKANACHPYTLLIPTRTDPQQATCALPEVLVPSSVIQCDR